MFESILLSFFIVPTIRNKLLDFLYIFTLFKTHFSILLSGKKDTRKEHSKN